jgi:ligand-binding sensor domain-containing protein
VGVSRFDGYRFTNYTMEDGLTNPLIQNIVEDNNGVYWLGASAGSNLTNGGIYRFDSRAKLTTDANGRVTENMFVHYKIGSESGAQDIFNLFKDRRGQIFAATSEGLFLLNDAEPERKFSRIALDVPGAKGEEYNVFVLAEDTEGSLWIGHDYGLTRRSPDGTTVSYELEPNGEKQGVRTISVDRQNRIWLATRQTIRFRNAESADGSWRLEISPGDARPRGRVVDWNRKRRFPFSGGRRDKAARRNSADGAFNKRKGTAGGKRTRNFRRFARRRLA